MRVENNAVRDIVLSDWSSGKKSNGTKDSHENETDKQVQ